jgi:hypothetical protein
MSITASVNLTNPFPGLRPFRSKESESCGQEDQNDGVVYVVSRERFLARLGLLDDLSAIKQERLS